MALRCRRVGAVHSIIFDLGEAYLSTGACSTPEAQLSVLKMTSNKSMLLHGCTRFWRRYNCWGTVDTEYSVNFLTGNFHYNLLLRNKKLNLQRDEVDGPCLHASIY
jgi:hypothetical protein